MPLSSDERIDLSQLKFEHASQAVSLALIRLGMALDRWLDHAFNPNQPRVPAGHPDGGQWTDGDDGDDGDDGTAVINDPPVEEVYPELLILPFLRIPRILNAWRVWALRRRESREWSLGKFKSAKRWANQMEGRNWTPEDITETIRNGENLKRPTCPGNMIRQHRQRGTNIMAATLCGMIRPGKFCRLVDLVTSPLSFLNPKTGERVMGYLE